MSNNYKVVEVYISYCEYSISKLDIIKGDGLDKVVKNVFDNIVDKGEIDLEDEENSMMYNIIGVKDNIGFVNYGEENVILVIDEKSKWYNKVDEFNLDSIEKEVDFSNGKYNEEDWDNWVELINSEVE